MGAAAPPQRPPNGSGALSTGNGAHPAPPPPPSAAPNARTLYAGQAPALGSSPAAPMRAPSGSDLLPQSGAPGTAEIYPRAVTFQPDADHAPASRATLALLAIAFLISAGIGLGATVLIGALIG